eukprot:INCI1557.2.p1 GENE.INCI1557.2~~INCI1557.2.p1  ORF type:complete len:746 (+),score=105.66 INCI1557.2:417-2654(+)
MALSRSWATMERVGRAFWTSAATRSRFHSPSFHAPDREASREEWQLHEMQVLRWCRTATDRSGAFILKQAMLRLISKEWWELEVFRLPRTKKFALVASVTENSVACLHLDTGEVSFPYDGFNGPTDVAISDDGLFAVVANSGAGNLGYIDLHTQEVSFSSGPVAANFTEMRGLALVPGKYGPSSAVVVLARAHAGGDTVPFELMNFELPETLKAARAVAPLRGPMERFDAEAIRAVLDAESECSSQDATKGDTCNGLKGHAQKGISPDAPVLQRTPLHCNIADRSVQASVDGAYAAAREMLTRLDSEAPFEAQIRMSMEKCDLPTLRQVLDAVKERVAKGQLQVVEKGPLHKVLKDALRCLRNRTAAVEMFLVDRLGAEAVKSVTPHMMDSDYALLGELVDRCNTEAESALVFRDITSSGGDIKSQTEKVIRAKQVACKRSKESHSMEPGAAVQEAADLQRVLQTLASELHQASAHQSKIVAEVERAECSQSQQLLAWTQEVASQQHFDSIAREKQERATAILQQISERNLQFHREAHERLTTRAVGFDTLSDLARQRKDALKEVKKAWEKLITTPCAVSFVLGPGHLPTLLACLGQRHWEKSFSRRNVAPSRLLQMTDEQILRLVAEEDADASFGEARAFRLALQSIEAGKGIPQGCASKYFSVRPGEPAVLPSTLPFWSVGQVIAHFQTESESMKDLKFVSQECARLRISGAVLMSMSQVGCPAAVLPTSSAVFAIHVASRIR